MQALWMWLVSAVSHFLPNKDPTLFDFHAVDIHQQAQPLSNYKGNVTLVVNVASKCGLAEINYRELQQLNDKYYEQGLRILAFPCNQFARQEPGTEAEIMDFTKQYGVTFDIFSKIKIVGEDTSPMFKWLKKKLPGSLTNTRGLWNYTKFLCDRNGVPYWRYGPNVSPSELVADIEKLLLQKAEL